jgi:hypothetical protein
MSKPMDAETVLKEMNFSSTLKALAATQAATLCEINQRAGT